MAGEDPAYLRWVRQRRCILYGQVFHVDMGWKVEAHHAHHFGMGQRSHDHTAIPLCTYHHRCWHDSSGPFKGWTREQRREWEASQIAATRDAWVVEQEMVCH